MEQWIFGQNLEGDKEYILHLRAPRFIARVFAGTEAETDADEQAVNAGQGIENEVGETIIIVEWIDQPPLPHLIDALLRSAATAHEIYTQDSFEKLEMVDD